MKELKRIVLVQFFLHDAMELDAIGNTSLLGDNGTGKSSLLDAVQIAMLGANLNFLKFNALTDRSSGAAGYRSIRGYCLGMFKPEQDESLAVRWRRDQANTYITLVFHDPATGECVSPGVALTANIGEPTHTVEGLYVIPGVDLTLKDHMENIKDREVPLHWKDFHAMAASRAAAAGTSATVTVKPETYVNEMLHVLSPKVTVNVRDFLRAFSKSVSMKDIGTVDEFVRRYLVEAQSVDRQRAMVHVETLRKLHKLIESVRQNIATLAGFQGQFEKIASAARRAATLEVLQHTYEVERAGDDIETAAVAFKAAEDALEKATELKETLDGQLLSAEANLLSLRAAQKEDARALQHEQLGRDIARAEEDRQRAAASVQTIVGHVGAALGLLGRLDALSSVSGRLESTWTALVSAWDRVSSAGLGHMPEALDAADKALAEIEVLFETERLRVSTAVTRAEERQAAAAARVRSLRDKGVDLGDDAAMALALFERADIRATPICSLVSVSDTAWQPAIEAYLKSNCESLLVEEGREKDAVRILRRHPEAASLYNARVVMPSHIDTVHFSDPAPQYVGSLIRGTDRVAVAYVRQLLRGVVKAETEDDLEAHKRALTSDGMAAGSGSVQRLRMPAPEGLKFGRSAVKLDVQQENAILGPAAQALAAAKAAYSTVSKVSSALSLVRQHESLKGSAQTSVDQWVALGATITDLSRQRSEISLDHVKELGDRVAAATDLAERLRIERNAAADAVSDAKGEMKSSAAAEAAAREAQRTAIAAEMGKRASPDFDKDLAGALRDDIDKTTPEPSGGYGARLERVAVRLKQANSTIENTWRAVAPAFINHIETVDRLLIEERGDWRKAHTWTANRRKLLEETNLAGYLQEAANARSAAEEAFRTDVAIKLQQGIRDMRYQINALNSIMRACPPFQHGERYIFTYKARPEHADLLRAIESSGDSFQLTDDGPNDAVMSMLDMAAQEDGKRAPTPLDDFRLLFSFDVDIQVDGRHSGWLSQRMGPGSNGEHRTPFYIVQGAALAHAYRLDPRSNPTSGLMLVDEAFYAMDPDNSAAAGAFLSRLGLQMIMVGPPSEYTKLAPMSDRVVNLMKFGDDEILMEVDEIKEKARDLLMSDSLMKHPSLLDDMEARITAERASG